jgi:hypothetical protein
MAASAQPWTLPQNDANTHEGVQSCVGAPCHGHRSQQSERVWLNEGTLWRIEDVHSKAYNVLFNERSKRIAKNLGLAQPAHESRVCLDCHADSVPADRRGRRFTLDEGIGCEACHGGASGWLKSHAAGASRKSNLERGMYPTDDPDARAALCLSCHFGNSEKFVDHRLMGAGHPRQSFELHVYTQTMPAHYEIDKDYIARGKQAPSGVSVWAVGQAMAVQAMLDVLLDREQSHHGVWPEFVLFDCHACHHRMSEDRWRPRPSVGLGPGLARLNDSSFLMLQHALRVVDPEKAVAFERDVRALHQAMSEGTEPTRPIALRLRETTQAVIPKLSAWQADSETARKLTRAIVDEGLRGEYIDYAAAEQATMALNVLILELYDRRAYENEQLAVLVAELELLRKATKEPELYQPDAVEASLQRIQKVL